jgi:hypothetical protein
MPRLSFTPNLQRHVSCATLAVEATSVRGALDAAFVVYPALRGYLLDDQGRLRQHVSIFVDAELIVDRERQSDRVHADTEIYVVQALSGG